MATPSSKHYNPGTMGSSPPGSTSAPTTRPFSYKSPSARTPSASGGGAVQQQQIQKSGSGPQQYATAATPLGTGALDDPIAFGSPSALLALGGYSGITPSPAAAAGNEGLDLHDLGVMHGMKIRSSRDSDKERRRNAEGVVQTLSSRVSGRGVCREGVERLGRLEGFESIWQEDNLSIAGNFVDLEIAFYPGWDAVKDVNLNYATPEAATTEGERREKGTAVLKRDLVQSAEERDQGVWKPLNSFHENLRRLAKLDRLSQEVNCFEAIEGLYASLRRIWEEERNRFSYNGEFAHLCQGSVGRPCLHKANRIGLCLDYWVERSAVLDAKQRKQASPDAMVIDQTDSHGPGEEPGIQHKMGDIIIECEEGYPSLRVSRDWVNSEPLTSAADTTTEEGVRPDINDTLVVNWADPLPTFTSMSSDQHDPMAIDSGVLESPTPNRKFVARIEPAVNVPALVAFDIYRLMGAQLPQDFKMVTYEDLLVSEGSALSLMEAVGAGSEGSAQQRKRSGKVRVHAFDLNGKPFSRYHGYTFQAFESAAGRTLHEISFSHPRQLVEIIPVCAIILWTEPVVVKAVS